MPAPANNRNDIDLIICSSHVKLKQSTKSVYLDGDKIEIRGLSYRFLEVLILSDRQLLTYEALSTAVWQKPQISEEVIAQRASLVRKLLKDKDKQLFESVRGAGYQWLQPVEVTKDEKEQHLSSEAPSPIAPKSARFLAPYLFISVIVIGAFSIFNVTNNSIATAQIESKWKNSSPLILERAKEYFGQHTEASSKIALTLYQQYLDQNGFEPEAVFSYVQAILQRVAKFERNSQLLSKAQMLIEKIESIDNEYPSIYWLKGYYFDVLGDLNSAIQFYEKSIRLGEQPQARAAGALAYLYTQQGKLFEATQLNIAALEGDGFYRLLQLAEIFYLIELEPDAQKWIEHAYQLAPNESFTAVQYAKYLFANNNIAEAKEVLNTFHTLDAETEDSLVLLATLEIANSQWKAAQESLSKASAIAPNSTYVLSLSYWLNKVILGNKTVNPPAFNESDFVWPSALVAHSMVHIANKELDLASQLLKKAFEQGYLDYQMIIKNPVFNELSENTTVEHSMQEAKRILETERAKITLMELPNLSQLLLAK